jgi:hypothetical protein
MMAHFYALRLILMAYLRKCIAVGGPVRPVPEDTAFESLDGERLWWLSVW